MRRHAARHLLPVLVSCLACCFSPGRARGQTVQLASPNPDTEGQFGNALSAVPDVTGDGLSDVIAGAWQETVSGVLQAGRAYLFSGSTGALVRTFVSPNFSDAVQDDARFGCSAAGLRDVNGDSVGDIIIGAYREDISSTSNAGRAYVFSGATGALLYTLTAPTPAANAFFGFTVAAVPDLDDDGIDDVAVCALIDRVGTVNLAGRVYIFSGATGTFLRSVVSPTPQSNSRFGNGLAGIVDVTGDGRGDVVVGAYIEAANSISSAGKVYVFDGATGAVFQTLISPNAETSGGFGFSVATIARRGGGALLLVGAHQEGATDAGRAYLYYSDAWTSPQTFTAPFSEPGAKFGWSTALVPDLNGDTIPDLAIAARYEDGVAGPTDAGRVHIYSGATGSLIQTFESPNAENTGACGYIVAAIPDRNGDGLGDLAIGAIMEDPGAAPDNSGRAYIFSLGGCSGVRGDFDGDFAVTAADVPGFVAVLLNNSPSAPDICRADMNQDTHADGVDVQAFVNCLNGNCT